MLTLDTLFKGRLVIYQPKEGYRFSLDALLLAGLTKVKPDEHVIDLGTGCGVVPLIMAYQRRGGTYVGVEIQPELVTVAKRNVAANRFADRIKIRQMDFREVADHFTPHSFDLVVSNPPYRELRTGRINPVEQKAIARHEIAGSVSDVFSAGRHLLPDGGRIAVIYPASRLDHLFRAAYEFGFSAKELTLIHSTVDAPARLAHLECRKGGGKELRINPPFIIYTEDGSTSEQMQEVLGD